MNQKRKIRKGRIALVIALIVILVIGIFAGVKLFSQDQSKKKEESENKVIEEPKKEYIGTVVLDAGHDILHGGCAKDGVTEQDITLKYAKEIGRILEENHVKVVYTREDENALDSDRFTCLRKRAELGESYNADYFISIHVNSLDGMKNASGFEIYTVKKYKDSVDLAEIVAKHIEKLNFSPNKGILDGSDLRVLRLSTTMPILIELGYITGNDFSYLTDEKKTTELSQVIADGIIEKINKGKLEPDLVLEKQPDL